MPLPACHPLYTEWSRECRSLEHATRASSHVCCAAQLQPLATASDDAKFFWRRHCFWVINICLSGVYICRYGNRLHTLPEAALGLPSLRGLWLEANPLDNSGDLRPAAADHHLALGPNLKNVGLDQYQVFI